MPAYRNDQAAQQERQLRRKAARFDYALRKSRTRNPEAVEYGKYLIVRPQTDYDVFGGWVRLDDVEAFFAEVAS